MEIPINVRQSTIFQLTLRAIDHDIPLIQRRYNNQPVSKQLLPHRDSSSGILSTVPHEVQFEIYNYLDLVSLGKLCQTSFATKNAVESMTAFGKITFHAMDFLRSLRAQGLVHVNSLGDLNRAFNSTSCDVCGDYGSYFFPLTSDRCCFFCLTTNIKFSLISKDETRKWFGPRSTVGLPYLSTFFPYARSYLGTKTEYFSVQEVKENCCKRYRKQYYKCPKTCSKATRSSQRIQTQKFWQPDPDPYATYKGALIMPHLPSRMSKSIDSGLYCKACYIAHPNLLSLAREDPWADVDDNIIRNSNKRARGGMVAYTVDGFLEHFKTCKHSREVMRTSRETFLQAHPRSEPFYQLQNFENSGLPPHANRQISLRAADERGRGRWMRRRSVGVFVL